MAPSIEDLVVYSLIVVKHRARIIRVFRDIPRRPSERRGESCAAVGCGGLHPANNGLHGHRLSRDPGARWNIY